LSLGLVNLHTVSRLREASDNQLSEPLTVFNDQQPHLRPTPQNSRTSDLCRFQACAGIGRHRIDTFPDRFLGPDETQHKLRPACWTVFYAYGRPMGFNDAANNRQPQPSTSLALTVTPPEPLKDELAVGDGDSGTSIQDAHAAVLLDDNLDVGAVSRMVDGIFHKVANGRSQHFRIAADPDGSVGSSQDDVFPLGHRKGEPIPPNTLAELRRDMSESSSLPSRSGRSRRRAWSS
jgi:hypothetical protein